MKPISQLSAADAQRLEGLFFDLDDTLLDDGQLSEAAYSALFRLRESGLRLIALTGRPAAWAELVARMWPVEAAIAENGALAYGRQDGRVALFDSVKPHERARRRIALTELVRAAQTRFPKLVAADDVGGRISDYTFDIGEHERLDEATVLAARAFAHRAGAHTTRSSVHLHYTFDRADKATGALGYVAQRGQDPTRARRQFAFVGDSDNDAACFAAFSISVGVSNLRGNFSIRPRFVTRGACSEGFVEFSRILVSSREATA